MNKSSKNTTANRSIVFITTNTQGQNMVSAYGQRGGGETPCIDRFAAEAVLFENAFCAGMNQDEGFFPIRGIRTSEWKLVVNLFDRDELYHLTENPDEAVNRIDDPACATVRNELHDRLLAWQNMHNDAFRSPQWKLRPWRTDAKHRFEGLFTTGYKDAWHDHDFHAPVRQGPRN